MYLQNLMSNYLTESNQKFEIEDSFKPITSIKKNTWKTFDNNLKKVYEFEKTKFLEQFVLQLIKYNRETSAEIEIRFRKNEVGIILHALSGQVSEIEIEASKDIDKIKKDVMYYYADKEWLRIRIRIRKKSK